LYRCDPYQQATQTVFGEGAAHATIVFVGEQPGDQENRAGHPPLAILRHPEEAQREEGYRRFVEDLRRIAQFLKAQNVA
jgi:hypothetical protein